MFLHLSVILFTGEGSYVQEVDSVSVHGVSLQGGLCRGDTPTDSI